MTAQNRGGWPSNACQRSARAPTASAVRSEYAAKAGRRPRRSDTTPNVIMPASWPAWAVTIQASERPMLWCIPTLRKLGSQV